ncbi:MAG: hypothetical protein Q4E86_04875, partial [Lachnospiraceae bacterium]|nr:hypothetical protein [Lachnospiraceae bacterium]
SGSGSGSGSSYGSRSGSGSSILTGGAWQLDEKGWWYQYTDNTYAKGGWYSLIWQGNTDWYYFNEEGYLISGWYTENEHTYYLHPIHDGNFGRMYTGWNFIDGTWYYFNEVSDGTKGALIQGMEVPAELLNQ